MAEEAEKQNEQNDESPREYLVAEDEKHEELCAEEDASDVLSVQEEHARKKKEACEKGKGEGGCETEPARPVATPSPEAQELDAQSSQATVPAEAVCEAGSASAPGDIVVINSTTHKREYMRLAP